MRFVRGGQGLGVRGWGKDLSFNKKERALTDRENDVENAHESVCLAFIRKEFLDLPRRANLAVLLNQESCNIAEPSISQR